MKDERAVSAILREEGQRLAKIGKAIEDSQVEDGDPPYEIPRTSLMKLQQAIASCLKACHNLKGCDAEDYGEGH